MYVFLLHILLLSNNIKNLLFFECVLALSHFASLKLLSHLLPPFSHTPFSHIAGDTSFSFKSEFKGNFLKVAFVKFRASFEWIIKWLNEWSQ